MRISELESMCSQAIHDARLRAADEGVRLHLRNGLSARHYTLRHCREYLERNCFEETDEPLSANATTAASLHLNAYYLNLRGAFDNIAWAFQLKLDLFPGVTEANGKRQSIYLFGQPFINALEQKVPTVATAVGAARQWGLELAKLRDPAAHRIPLYVPPNMITTQEQYDEFQRLNELAGLPDSELNGRNRVDLMIETRRVAPFIPVFCITSQEGITAIYSIPEKLIEDHRQYLQLVLGVLKDL